MNKRDVLYIVIIATLVLILIFCISKCSTYNDQYRNNIKAMQDSISYVKSKTNDLIATTTVYNSNIKDLKKLNNDLYNEIKNMKIPTSKVETIIKYEGNINNPSKDTSYFIKYDTIYKGFSKSFDFSNKYRELRGIVNYVPDSMKIKLDKDITYFDYTIGVDKNNKVYIKSTNPYVNYKSITGFTITKERKKYFGIGPQIGYGLEFKNMKLSPYIGIGIHYDLIQF